MHFLTTDYVISWLQTNFDIVFVTETHLIKGTRFSVTHFTAFHNPVSDYKDRKPHGCISCFIRSSILHLITKVEKDISETIIVFFIGGHRVFGNYIVPASSPFFDEGAFTRVANQFYPKNSNFVVVGGGEETLIHESVTSSKNSLFTAHTGRMLTKPSTSLKERSGRFVCHTTASSSTT